MEQRKRAYNRRRFTQLHHYPNTRNNLTPPLPYLLSFIAIHASDWEGPRRVSSKSSKVFGERIMRGSAIATLLCAALIGCTANDTAIYHKWDIDGEESDRSVIIDAKQRAIISVKRFSTDNGHLPIRKFCAEPSPDALSAISSSFATSLSVGVFGQGEGAGALSSSLSEAASELGRRNATIQLLRDGYYRLCEAHLNEALSAFQYNLLARKLADQMIILLAIEQLTPSDKEELRITTGGNSTVTVNTSAKGGGSPTPGPAPTPGGTTPPSDTPSGGPGTPPADGSGPPPADPETENPPVGENPPPTPSGGSGTNGGIPPSGQPSDEAPELLNVKALATHRGVLNGARASDSYVSVLPVSMSNGQTVPAKAMMQVAQAAPASGESSGAGAGGTETETPPSDPGAESVGDSAPESEESAGSILEGSVEVTSEADAESGAPAVATKISQGRTAAPSPEVSRAVAFIIAKYLNQSRFADCLLALDNITFTSTGSLAETAIIEGCGKVINSVAQASKDPSDVFGYGVLSGAKKETATKPGDADDKKKE
jgi:hypothetical protein